MCQGLLLKHLVIQVFQVQNLLKFYHQKIRGIMIIKVIIKFRIISLIMIMKLIKTIDSNNPNPINKIQSINQYFYQKYYNLENMIQSNNNKIGSRLWFSQQLMPVIHRLLCKIFWKIIIVKKNKSVKRHHWLKKWRKHSRWNLECNLRKMEK